GLGTNGTVTSGQIRDLLAEIGPSRELVLVNTYAARPWEHADNGVISAAARRYPNVVLANWHATIAHRTNLLSGDGVHPRPPGARLYAKAVAAAVQSTASVPPAGHSPASESPSAVPGPMPGGSAGPGPTPGGSARQSATSGSSARLGGRGVRPAGSPGAPQGPGARPGHPQTARR